MSYCSADWSVLQQAIDHLSPSEKLHLIEEVARSLRSPATAPDFDEQKARLARLRSEMAALPVLNPDDGFSNRDHDQCLYGEPR
jgi:hypothetical protein